MVESMLNNLLEMADRPLVILDYFMVWQHLTYEDFEPAPMVFLLHVLVANLSILKPKWVNESVDFASFIQAVPTFVAASEGIHHRLTIDYLDFQFASASPCQEASLAVV